MIIDLPNRVKNKINHELRGFQNTKLFPEFRNNFKIPTNSAIVDVTSRRLERHYYFIIKFLSLSGYTVFLIKNRSFLGGINLFKNEFGNIPNVYLANKNQVSNVKLYFYDYDSRLGKLETGKKIFIRIDTFNKPENVNGILNMPLPMSVEQYDILEERNLIKFRSTEREMRIFYSGNLDKNSYDLPEIKSVYRKLSRLQIINSLKNKLSKDQIDIKQTVANLNSPIKVPKFVLYDWFWKPDESNLKARIANKDWLFYLSKADFFLGCPGIVMPPTHAIVEAMAVGSIPIIEFPEFYPNGLEHMVNCLIFTGEEDLILKVNLALSLPDDKIKKMKNEVLKYYDENLTPQAYIKKLESADFDQINYFVYTDYSHISN